MIWKNNVRLLGSVVADVDEAIDEWRRRLQACVRAEGRHFEHLL